VFAIAAGYSALQENSSPANVPTSPRARQCDGLSVQCGLHRHTDYPDRGPSRKQGHAVMEPLLYGPLVADGGAALKWAVEVTWAGWRICRGRAPRLKSRPTPPTGPCVISLPCYILRLIAASDSRPLRPRFDTRSPSDEALHSFFSLILKASGRSSSPAMKSSRAMRC